MKIFTILFVLLTSVCSSFAATSMVGACTAREAKVWIKTTKLPSEKITAKCANRDGKVVSISKEENCAVVVFSKLSPNTKYNYTISDGVETLSGSFKTRPDYEERTPPPDFSFALFGRNHINDKEFDPPFLTPGGEYQIYETARKTMPNFAIWVGGANDLRPADIDSRSAIFARFAHARDLNEAKQFLANTPNYGVASISNFGGKDSSKSNARDARDAFNAFWANPQSVSEKFDAYSFKYSDAEFFVLDDVSQRSNLDYLQNRPYILGEAQLLWLMTALDNSNAKFKIIVMNSPMMNPVEKPDNFTFAKDERKRLLDFLVSKKITGVILVSGNKDYGEMTRFVRAGGYPLFEITTPPLTARPTKEIKDMNYFRIPSSGITERAFTLVKIEGQENARTVTINFVNSKGDVLFTTNIKESDLNTFN